MSDSDPVVAEAHRWIDSLERKWRLQILSKRYRRRPLAAGESDSDGDGYRTTELPLRIRRFAEGIPYACVDEAMRYLLSLAPYRDVLYNGMVTEGTYVPTVTTWKRDDSETVNGISRTDGTYTLIQDLVEISALDQYGVGTAKSCSEEVVTEWTWDAPGIGEIPEPGRWQGVTYAVQSVSRNEDGTFNYALVKRVAKMQHTPRVATKVTAEETVETETWDNLYGEPWEFTDQDGVPVEVPQAGFSREDGTRTEIQLAKNDDCTYRLQAVHVTAGSDSDLPYVADASCAGDVEHVQHWHDPQVEDVTSRGQGETRSIQNLRREDDGTYSYVVVTRMSATQDTGYRVQADTLAERVDVRTVSNVYGGAPGAGSPGWMMRRPGSRALEAMDPPIPEPGVYGRVRVELQLSENEDCTFRIVVTRTEAKRMAAERQTSKNQYEWNEMDRRTGEDSSLGDAPSESGGAIVTHESQLQPDGTFANRVSVRTERPVPRSTVTVSVGRRGRRVTVVDTNQESEASFSDVQVGGSVRVEKTPGGLFNNTVTTWDKSQQVKAGDLCTIDVFHHQHDVTKSEESMPSDSDHVQGSGANGLVVTRRVDMDEEGAISSTTSKNQEILAPRSEESWQMGLHGIVHTVKHRNVAPSDADHYGAEPTSHDLSKVGSSLRRDETPGGWYDVTIADVDRVPGIRSGAGCSKTVFLHTDTAVSSRAALPGESDADRHVEDAGLESDSEWEGLRGVYRSSDVRVNADGTVTGTDTVNVEVPVKNAQMQDEDTAFVRTSVALDKNQPSAYGAGTVRLDPRTNVLTVKSATMNPGGSYDVRTETRIPHFRWWQHVTDTNWRWSATVWFRNATTEDVRRLYAGLVHAFNAAMEGAEPSGGYLFAESDSDSCFTDSAGTQEE